MAYRDSSKRSALQPALHGIVPSQREGATRSPWTSSTRARLHFLKFHLCQLVVAFKSQPPSTCNTNIAITRPLRKINDHQIQFSIAPRNRRISQTIPARIFLGQILQSSKGPQNVVFALNSVPTQPIHRLLISTQETAEKMTTKKTSYADITNARKPSIITSKPSRTASGKKDANFILPEAFPAPKSPPKQIDSFLAENIDSKRPGMLISAHQPEGLQIASACLIHPQRDPALRALQQSLLVLC